MDELMEQKHTHVDEVREIGQNEHGNTGENTPIVGLEGLRELQVGTQIDVHRLAPQAVRGHLGFLMIPDTGLDGVLTEIKNEWGGGHYQLRAKQTNSAGKSVYIRGAAKVDIAGFPKFQDREYINGTWRYIEQPVNRTPLPMMPTPSSGEGKNSILEAIQVIAPYMQQGNMGGIENLPALITALSGITGTPKERDNFGDMRRMLEFMQALKESPLGGGSEKSSEPMSMESIVPMMMMKMFNEQNRPATPPYYPSPYGYPTPPGAIPQNQIPQNQIHQNYTTHPQSTAHYPSPPMPPGAVPPPVSPVSNPSNTKPPPVQPNPVVYDDDAYEPITVPDIVDEIQAKPEPERLKFLMELCESLGLDQKIIETMFPHGAPTDSQQFPRFDVQLNDARRHANDSPEPPTTGVGTGHHAQGGH